MAAALRGRLNRRVLLLVGALVVASTGIGTTLAVNYFYGETSNGSSVYQTRTLYDPTAIGVTVKDNNTATVAWTNPTQQEAGLRLGNGDGIAITGSYASTQPASCTSALTYTDVAGVVPSGATQTYTDSIGATPGSPLGAWVCYRVSTWTASNGNPATWNSSTTPLWTALNVGTGAIASTAVQVGFVATATATGQAAGHALKKNDTLMTTFDQATNAPAVPAGYYLCVHHDATSGVDYAYLGMAVAAPTGSSCAVTSPAATPTILGYLSGGTVTFPAGSPDCIWSLSAAWNSPTNTAMTLTLGALQNGQSCSSAGGTWTYHPPTAAITGQTVLQTAGSSGTRVYGYDGSNTYYALPTTTGGL